MSAIVEFSPADRTRLVALLSRLASDFEGERAAAGLLANRIVQDRHLSWEGLLVAAHAAQQPRAPDTQRPWAPRNWRTDLEFCRRHLHWLTSWETDFVLSVAVRRTSLTPNQISTIASIADKLRGRGLA